MSRIKIIIFSILRWMFGLRVCYRWMGRMLCDCTSSSCVGTRCLVLEHTSATAAQVQSVSDATGSSSTPVIDGSCWSGAGNVNLHRNCTDLTANHCYIISGCRDTAPWYPAPLLPGTVGNELNGLRSREWNWGRLRWKPYDLWNSKCSLVWRSC